MPISLPYLPSVTIPPALSPYLTPRLLASATALTGALILVPYLFAFRVPKPMAIHPGIDDLPKSNPLVKRLREIYPIDLYTGGRFHAQPWGKTRYWILGDKGLKVVLIHGFAIPSISWQKIAPYLAEHGFQVLVLDLWGRGYSDAPEAVYDARFYVTQIALLMQHLGWERAYAVGLSMGGAIAAAFAAEIPNLVSGKVALIATAGVLEPEDIPTMPRIMSAPVVQPLISSSWFKSLVAPKPKSKNALGPMQEIVSLQNAVLPGYGFALNSSLRQGPITGMHKAFRTMALTGFKILIIQGKKDTVVPYKTVYKLKDLMPESQLHVIDGAGHDLLTNEEHWLEVAESLEKFLKS